MHRLRRPPVHVLALIAAAVLAPAAGRAQAVDRALDATRPLTYYIAPGSPESGFKQGDETLARWALEAWGKQLDPAVQMTPAPEASATVRIYWVAADEGLFGEMRARSVGGRFAADVFVHPDAEGLGAEIARAARTDTLFRDTIVYLTCVHELGHAFGLPHTKSFADIMYSFQYGGDFVAYFMRFRGQLRSRDDVPGAEPFSPADRAAFRALHPRAGGR